MGVHIEAGKNAALAHFRTGGALGFPVVTSVNVYAVTCLEETPTGGTRISLFSGHQLEVVEDIFVARLRIARAALVASRAQLQNRLRINEQN